jgi:hypothetical protein
MLNVSAAGIDVCGRLDDPYTGRQFYTGRHLLFETDREMANVAVRWTSVVFGGFIKLMTVALEKTRRANDITRGPRVMSLEQRRSAFLPARHNPKASSPF